MSSISGVLRDFPRARSGAPGDPGLFGPDSVAWKVNGEAAMIVGGGRALLMQVAHPLVAAGVAQHSQFPRDSFERLWRTLDAMLTISFGDSNQWKEAADRVTHVHEGVRGTSGEGVEYDALDPGLLLWVHATLVDSALVTYERLVGLLRAVEKERYYQEMKRQATVLRVPDEVLPETLEDFHSYVEATIPTLEVSDDALALRDGIVSPDVPFILRPVSAWMRALTIEMLPGHIREGFGLRQSTARRATAEMSSAVLRFLLPLVPRRGGGG
ncbi:MAG: oxygenase MpaB family protein, partial [Actinomycetota bacterium]